MNKGYTLIEVLAAVVIFSLISGAALGIFALAIKIQKYSLASQQLLDQTGYAMEYMNRAIRMAKKNGGECSNMDIGKNYEETLVGRGIKFVNYKGECLEFFQDDTDNQLKVNKWEDGIKIFDTVELISDDFEVTSLNFNISGDEPGDNSQPKVTIYMEIKGKNMSPLPKIKIQTTLSQRNLDE